MIPADVLLNASDELYENTCFLWNLPFFILTGYLVYDSCTITLIYSQEGKLCTAKVVLLNKSGEVGDFDAWLRN